jgi:hypothetical protein
MEGARMDNIIVILLVFAVAFGMFAIMTIYGDKAWAKACGAISIVCFVVAIGLGLWSNTCMTHKMHDVDVRLYYLDGSQEVLHFDGLYYGEPHLDCRGRIPFFCAGRVTIPCVSRFEIIGERIYEVKGRDLRPPKPKTKGDVVRFDFKKPTTAFQK